MIIIYFQVKNTWKNNFYDCLKHSFKLVIGINKAIGAKPASRGVHKSGLG